MHNLYFLIKMSYSEYLQETDIIDFSHASVQKAAQNIKTRGGSDVQLARAAYEFVRDKIKHSADSGAVVVTCTASEVLREGHGICYAKSHLLAAILRRLGIPCGFGYQRLILDDIKQPWFVLHGYNFILIPSLSKWIKVDARGNKPGIEARFSLNEFAAAFPVRSQMQERDEDVNHASPKNAVIHCLRTYKTVAELMTHLPGDF